jgi:hypothetical protein
MFLPSHAIQDSSLSGHVETFFARLNNKWIFQITDSTARDFVETADETLFVSSKSLRN